MRQETWLDVALKLWGALSLLTVPALWFLGKGRRKATADITNLEAEAKKRIIETDITKLNVIDIIDKRVSERLEQFKNVLWDAQEMHMREKNELKHRLEEALRRETAYEKKIDELETRVAELEKSK